MHGSVHVLANPLFSLRDINLTLGLLLPPLPPRRHVVWRDSVGVEGSRSGLRSECADIFHQILPWLLHHTDEPLKGRNSCLWLQSRSVFSSVGVVLMSCKLIFTCYDQHCSILLAKFNMSKILHRNNFPNSFSGRTRCRLNQILFAGIFHLNVDF